MDYQIYNVLGKAPRKNFDIKKNEDEMSLKDILSSAPESDVKLIFRAYRNDLNRLLQIDDIYSLIEHILHIDHDLKEIRIRISKFDEGEILLPSIEGMYKKLSPVLLRAVKDASLNKNNISEIMSSWKEALRVTIEEELFSLGQYKIL